MMMTSITHCFSSEVDKPVAAILGLEERNSFLSAYLGWSAYARDYAKANNQSMPQLLLQLCARWNLQHSPTPTVDASECSECPWLSLLTEADRFGAYWFLHLPTAMFAPITIQEAAKSGCTSLLRFLLQDDRIDPSLWPLHPARTKLDQGQNALHVACSSGQVEAAKVLLAWEAAQEHPGDLNERSDDGRTALASAALNGHAEVVRVLLETPGVDCNAPDKEGASPLFLAASKGHTQVVAVLLEHPGVLVEREDNEGNTSLLEAAYQGHDAVVSLLLADGRSNPNRRGAYGLLSPLMAAAMEGHVEVVRILLADARLDVNAPLFKMNLGGERFLDSSDADATTPRNEIGVRRWLKAPFSHSLVWALEKGLKMVDLSILHVAVQCGQSEIVRLLLLDGRVNPNPKHGRLVVNPLAVAAKEGHLDVVKVLLEDPRVDVNGCSSFIVTPLRTAAMNGFADIVGLLLAHGADPNLRGGPGNLRSRPLEKAAKQVQKPPEEWLKDPNMGKVRVRGCLKVIEMLLAHPAVDKKGFKMPKIHPTLA